MNSDLVLIALLAGAANWCFRALPVLLMRGETRPEGLLAGFLAATGPAAIATLFTASIMGALDPMPENPVPLVAGVLATVLAFLPRRSVVVATLSGALACGLTHALLIG